jgi:hypothetical protein
MILVFLYSSCNKYVDIRAPTKTTAKPEYDGIDPEFHWKHTIILTRFLFVILVLAVYQIYQIYQIVSMIYLLIQTKKKKHH